MKDSAKKTKFQSIWYTLTGLSIIGLIITGFEIHGSYSLLGYRAATVGHDILFTFTLFLGVLYIFWSLVTGIKPGVISDNERPRRYINITLTSLIWVVMAVSGSIYIGFVIFHDFFAANINRAAVAYLHTIGAYLVISTGILHLYYALATRKVTEREIQKARPLQQT